jgi:amino acid permease
MIKYIKGQISMNLASNDENNIKHITFLPLSSSSFSFTPRLNNTGLSLNKETMKNIRTKVLTACVSLLMITIFSICFVYGIDKHIENQDTMLCNSAVKSGNREYLQKCQCFYKGESIKCLQ